jgi:hypothetical protein
VNKKEDILVSVVDVFEVKKDKIVKSNFILLK